jgi:hypothetical protein
LPGAEFTSRGPSPQGTALRRLDRGRGRVARRVVLDRVLDGANAQSERSTRLASSDRERATMVWTTVAARPGSAAIPDRLFRGANSESEVALLVVVLRPRLLRPVRRQNAHIHVHVELVVHDRG